MSGALGEVLGWGALEQQLGTATGGGSSQQRQGHDGAGPPGKRRRTSPPQDVGAAAHAMLPGGGLPIAVLPTAAAALAAEGAPLPLAAQQLQPPPLQLQAGGLQAGAAPPQPVLQLLGGGVMPLSAVVAQPVMPGSGVAVAAPLVLGGAASSMLGVPPLALPPQQQQLEGLAGPTLPLVVPQAAQLVPAATAAAPPAPAAAPAAAPEQLPRQRRRKDAEGTGSDGSRGNQGQATDDDKGKTAKRMIKNRESAARSRQRRLEYTASLEQQVEQLKAANRSLRERVIRQAAAPPDPHAGRLDGQPLRRTRTTPL